MRGIVDIHCHILPGVDDGAVTDGERTRREQDHPYTTLQSGSV